jgi:hypothetical protein
LYSSTDWLLDTGCPKKLRELRRRSSHQLRATVEEEDGGKPSQLCSDIEGYEQ